MRYAIQYPSGKRFALKGRFVLTQLGDWIVPAILFGKDRAHVLDQRAIVFQGERQVYSPRRNLDGLDPRFTEWLKEHPEWDT